MPIEEPMEDLIAELKEKIIETLDLIDVTPEDINEDDRLVGGVLGIDSIDVLELVMMIDKDYSVKIDSKELGEKIFASLRTLADYIDRHRPEQAR
jgi:acyl carrier protein